MNFLEIKKISKSFENHQALKEVSLSIKKNSIYGLLGHNGAGKTTLIRILTRILQADSGEILFNGEPLTSSHVRQIGYLPEERGLYKKMKVTEHLLYLAQLKDIPKKMALETISEYLTKFQLEKNAKSEIGALSKGMQQKIQFIATVVNSPEFIILDEPFSGFDPHNVELIKQQILELKAKGATILYSTHRMESVDELCDDLAILNRSEKVLEGSIDQLKAQHNESIFTVKHKGKLQASPQFELIDSIENSGITSSTIRLINSPNMFLNSALQNIELLSFEPKKITVEDLFFKYVN